MFGITASSRLRVTVSEPDVSPLTVQGPQTENVVASIFGDWVRGLKYFWFRNTEIAGIPVAVARSGWSKQGGFELYLMDGSKGTQLWNIVREAGKPWGIGPGNPNACERIETGLLSYGGDTDGSTNPFEVRMGKYVDLDIPDDVIGIQALRRIRREGVQRQQLGVLIDGDQPLEPGFHWHAIHHRGAKVGDLTNCVWSYRLQRNIGFGLVAIDCAAGDRVEVHRHGQPLSASLCALPFL